MTDSSFHLNAVWSFDIDGTLTHYPNEWLIFIASVTGQKFTSTEEAKLQLGKKYAEIKHKYRLSEDKYSIKIRPEAKIIIDKINDAGGKIIISTSRPFHLYDQMKDNTENWLKNNDIAFDRLISKPVLPEYDFNIHVDDEYEEIINLYQKKPAQYIFLHKGKGFNIEKLQFHTNKVHFIGDINEISYK